MRIAITGASSGIGAAAAKILKNQGAEIIAIDILDPGDKADHWVSANFAHKATPQAICDAIDGSFDALLNIAGVPPRDNNAAEILAVNWRHLAGFTELFLDRLNDGAAIVNLASRAGNRWRDNLEQVNKLMQIDNLQALHQMVEDDAIDPTRAYCLSKEALIVWTIQQTERFAKLNIRMNCVSPSAVDTGILPDFQKALGQRAKDTIARTGRAADPQEVAEVVAFLATEASRWIKGENVKVDGGIDAMVTGDQITSSIAN